jgi:hypothetical protein
MIVEGMIYCKEIRPINIMINKGKQTTKFNKEKMMKCRWTKRKDDEMKMSKRKG